MFKKLLEYLWIVGVLMILIIITIYSYEQVYKTDIVSRMTNNKELGRSISSISEIINKQLE